MQKQFQYYYIYQFKSEVLLIFSHELFFTKKVLNRTGHFLQKGQKEKNGPSLPCFRLNAFKILVSISRQFTSTIFCVVTPVIQIYFCSASYNQLQFSGIKNRDKPGVYNLEQKTLVRTVSDWK